MNCSFGIVAGLITLLSGILIFYIGTKAKRDRGEKDEMFFGGVLFLHGLAILLGSLSNLYKGG